MRSRVALAAAITIALTACGSDGATSGVDDEAGTSTETSAEAIAPLTATEICERLTVASVAADTGLDVLRASPDDSATPQCAYEYANDTGAVSNLTVASMRPEDVGGLTGSDAFDFVVQINESVAGDGADTQAVSAGDAAIRISGTSLQLGVVQVDDQVLTVIIPTGDVEADAVDRLIATMATALG